MKKEFGKWLMDIAKYMVTALLISSVFSDMNEPNMFFVALFLSISVLVLGLSMLYEKNHKKKKGKIK